VVAALMAWGDKWEAPDGPPLVMRHTCGEQVAARMVCAACGEPIEFGAVRSKAGPGFRPAVVPPGK